MKINSKVLSIPPFISVAWKHVHSIRMENLDQEPSVVVFLTNSLRIELPPLDPAIVEAIFTAHAQYVEELPMRVPSVGRGFEMGSAFNGFPSGGLKSMQNPMQHNPEQSDAPDVPKEIIEKIVAISKVVGVHEAAAMPDPEPNCNCLHCQIAKAIQEEKDHQEDKAKEHSENEEEITLEDLRFRLWDIAQTAESLYLVSNPLDSEEHYHVCLGEPMGCTCGQKNCEHIRAVLNS